jgi:hypothetical protein
MVITVGVHSPSRKSQYRDFQSWSAQRVNSHPNNGGQPTKGSRTMEARVFCLTSADDETQVYAWGIEINNTEDDIEAVVYRRDPQTRRTTFGIHSSAEDALARYQRLFPMALSYES